MPHPYKHRQIVHSMADVADFHHPTANNYMLCLVPSKAHMMVDEPTVLLHTGMGICLHPLSPHLYESSVAPIVLFDVTQVYSFTSAIKRDIAASKLTQYNIKYDSRILSFIPGDEQDTQYVYMLLEVIGRL